ncbi:hypothetical protein [Flavobacterium sp. N1736]|uniref:hypothetical protein n=1 Tax=Flavobacterium sp. N1736 TaxID=2986823 RepID=UPI0022259F81|nr:hypothetical protein [Flavobacterium sp. N1736]
MDVKDLLSVVCVGIFAATGIITLLGLINKINIQPKFLNKLFIALILEIVAICLYIFKTQMTDNSNKVWLVTAKVRYLDENNDTLPTSEYIKEVFVQQSNPPVIIEKCERRVQFYAVGTDKTGRNIILNFTDTKNRFPDVSFNLKLDKTKKVNNTDGEIDIGTISFKKSTPYKYSSSPTNPNQGIPGTIQLQPVNQNTSNNKNDTIK